MIDFHQGLKSDSKKLGKYTKQKKDYGNESDDQSDLWGTGKDLIIKIWPWFKFV